MLNYNESTISISKPTLPLSGLRAYAFQIVLLGAVVVVPWLAHLSGAPVRYLLPMHWFVVLAGLVYGWRSGALVGFLAPIVSYFITGFPLPYILPSMTLELFTYGLIVGFLREQTKLNPYLAVVISLVVGRVVFVGSIFLGNLYAINRMEYLQAALIPGIVAAICQTAFLPLSAKWLIKQEQK
jgi:niacin transporter